MKAIMGAFRTTPTAALEIESDLMLTHLRLKSKILRAFTRLATLPQDHPASPILTRASLLTSDIYISPLEHLSRTFREYAPSHMETIHPYVRPPWWSPIARINIPPIGKEDAKKQHVRTIHGPNTILVYTDGSGIGGHVGAAAFSPTISQKR
jgi:hypothetical protein